MFNRQSTHPFSVCLWALSYKVQGQANGKLAQCRNVKTALALLGHDRIRESYVGCAAKRDPLSALT